MRRWLVAVSLVIHFAVIFTLFVTGMWRLERMEAGKHHIDLAVAPMPAPAPAGGSPRATPKFEHKPTPHLVHEVVQPTPRVIEAAPAMAPDTGTGDGSGSGLGSGSGSAGDTGPCTEHCGEAPQQPPVVAEKKQVTTIPPVVLRGLRIRGETQLQPPDVIKTTMMRDGTTRSMATFKVCLAATGDVTSVVMLRSSGYAGYDAVLTAGLATWGYRPYTLNGRAIEVCGVITFVYEMK